MNFEEMMRRLDVVVKALENGDASLEDSLKLFEEGTKLIRACSEILTNAEKKIEILRPTAEGGYCAQPFSQEDSENGLS